MNNDGLVMIQGAGDVSSHSKAYLRQAIHS